MPDRSSDCAIIVLEFNPEPIDSEIIAVHRIVSNMKKRKAGRGPKRAVHSRSWQMMDGGA